MEELQQQIFVLKAEVEDIRALLWKKVGGGSADIKGNMVQLSTVNATIATDSITQAMIGANAVGQSEWKYEQVSVQISDASTSNTGTVTSGSIIVSLYVSATSGTPTASYFRGSVSGTTLTVTLITAPGGGNSVTFTCVLLKS